MPNLSSPKDVEHEPTQETRIASRESLPTRASVGPFADILFLQRAAGNQATSRILQATEGICPVCGRRGRGRCPGCGRPFLPIGEEQIQTKLRVSEPADRYEQEADQAASRFMRLHTAAELTLSGISTAGTSLQRQEAKQGTASRATPDETPGQMLVVEDDATTLGPGQMKKSDFLAELRSTVCKTADEVLKSVGRSTAGCPYLDYWFGYYSKKPSQHIEAALLKFAPEARGASSARDYIPPITQRVRVGVEIWATTGKVTGVPEGVPLKLPGGGDESEASGGSASGVARKARDGAAGIPDSPEAIRGQLLNGRPIDAAVRSRMESAFGVSFAGVQFHTDNRAADLSNRLNARAFTLGKNIAFAAGEYQPGTLIGDGLIAHELAHVVQQGGGSESAGPMTKGQSESSVLEEDADVAAVGAVASLWAGTRGALSKIARNVRPSLKSGLRLQRCTGEKCPEGYYWQVINRTQIAGACDCTWACRQGASSYDTIDDPNRTPPLFLPGEKHTAGVGGQNPRTMEGMCYCMPLKDKDGNILGSELGAPPNQDYTAAAAAAAGMTQEPYRPENTTETNPRAAIIDKPTPGTNEAEPATPQTSGGGARGGAPAATTAPTTKAAAPPAGTTVPSGPAAPPATTAGGKAGAPRPTSVANQPNKIQEILEKNAPARNIEVQDKLAKDIDNYRSKPGVPARVDLPETPDQPVKGGTVAVARTNIPTLNDKPYGGASSEALPPGQKGKPGTTAGTILTPANPTAIDHAEAVALENLAKAIDAGLGAKSIVRTDLEGKQVWVRVEQEPCPSCAAGLDDPTKTAGPIKQFSERYPELTIEVRNERTSRSYYLKGGKVIK